MDDFDKIVDDFDLGRTSGYQSCEELNFIKSPDIRPHEFVLVTDKKELDYIEVLGEGSYGKVIAVKHRTDHKKYAVKIMTVLLGDREKYQARELELLTEQVDSSITHDNIVKYYDSWRYGERLLCIRMELCDTSLENLLQTKKEIVDSPSFYQHVFPQILSGLNHIHGKHWVHRDLYPANILMRIPDNETIRSWVVKLADFGLARKLEGSSSLTHSDPPEEVLSVVGHKLYRAPEMYSKKKSKEKYDDKDDTYSAGVVLYDNKVDMYSAGVVLYRLCCHFKNEDEIMKALESIVETRKVDKGKLSHNDELLYQLLDDLVNSDPKKRLSASQALEQLSQHGCETDSFLTQISKHVKEMKLEKSDDDYADGIC